MTATTLDKRASRATGAYGFRGVALMEWRKLRSVRSTWWPIPTSTGTGIRQMARARS